MPVTEVARASSGIEWWVQSSTAEDLALTYPAIQSGDLLLLLGYPTNWALTTPTGYSTIPPTGGNRRWKVADGTESGTLTLNYTRAPGGGTLYTPQHMELVVLRGSSWAGLTWGSLSGSPYNPGSLSASTDVVVYIGEISYTSGAAVGDNGYSVMDHATFNWDAALTVLSDIQVGPATNAVATDDARTQIGSEWYQVAYDEFPSGTIPASSNSITVDASPASNPGGPSRNFVRTTNAGLIVAEEGPYVGMLGSMT